MKRREFLKASLAAAALPLIKSKALADAPFDAGRQYYEYRIYRLMPHASPDLVEEYLENGLLPALGRRGVGPVGMFRQRGAPTVTGAPPPPPPEAGAEVTALHVVIPYDRPETFADVAATIDADPELRAAVPDYFSKPTKANPAFDRIDTALLLAFTGQPRLVLPSSSQDKGPRIFEIRTYDSFTEERALKKIDMFNSGEMGAQREVGLAPVFYGQALAGPNLPHLTYMVTAPDRATHKKHWKAFGKHPVWLRMKADPQYANTATYITSVILDPAPYSQM